MFKHILVPTDLTDRAVRTIDLLKEVVGETPVSLTLLHVVEQIPETDREEFGEFYSGLELRSAAKLATLASRIESPNIRLSQNVIYGRPAVEITRFAEAHNVDLIALASHAVNPTQPGRGWGTLSYKIGMLASCPVLLVK